MLPKTRQEKQKPSKGHQHAPKQEENWANKLGGQVVKGSGSGSMKGDVRVKSILRLENKCSAADSFRVTKEMIDKIENAGCQAGELPFIEVELLDKKTGKPTHKVAVVPIWALGSLIQE